MHCRIILVLVLALAGPVQGAGLPAVLKALHKAQPGVTWNVPKSQKADVTCDGKADTVIFGKKNKSIWVGVVSDANAPQVMEFGLGDGTQDGFCEVPVAIKAWPTACDIEDIGALPGCKPSKTCKAFSVMDDACDSFHFYWDSEKKINRWWRR